MFTEQQFAETYNKYADDIFRHCFFRVSNREKAKDIMQEAFTKTWEYLTRGNEIANIRAFIYRTANNLIIDHYRKKSESSLDELQEQGFEPPVDEKDKIHNEIDAGYAISAIQNLDIKYREVVLLRYVDELGVKEIAHIVGESPNTVSVRIYRGLAELRKSLKSQI